MRWYPVTKYRPTIHSSCMLLRLANKTNWFLSLGEYGRNIWLDWDHKEPAEFADYKVTHFCIPDPIEIE